tara:strand:+ start:3300 stop:3659 length:360 start_codon:yes stop_codon:yes gene_type:complete
MSVINYLIRSVSNSNYGNYNADKSEFVQDVRKINLHTGEVLPSVSLRIYAEIDSDELPAVLTAESVATICKDAIGDVNYVEGVAYTRSREPEMLPEKDGKPAVMRYYYKPPPKPIGFSQ